MKYKMISKLKGGKCCYFYSPFISRIQFTIVLFNTHFQKIYFLITFMLLLNFAILTRSKSIGYVGPSCAVVEDLLYMHGFYIRRLNTNEVNQFHAYQNALQLYRQLRVAVANGAASVPNNSSLLTAPTVPEFCNGLDDSIEVVLDGCTVRHNKVFVADQFIRSLNQFEQRKIEALLTSNTNLDFNRGNKLFDDQPSESTYEPHTTTVEEASDAHNIDKSDYESIQTFESNLMNIIGDLFNVNTSVTQRFIHPRFLRTLSSQLYRKNVENSRESDYKNENDNDDNEFNSHSNTPQTLHEEISMTNPIITSNENKGSEKKELSANKSREQQQSQLFTNLKLNNDETYTPPAGHLNINDPLLLNLLHSLAKQQTTVNEIVDNINKPKRPINNQGQFPFNASPSLPFVSTEKSSSSQQQKNIRNQGYSLPIATSESMRPGDKIVIGGQTYVAVPLNSFATPSNIPFLNRLNTTFDPNRREQQVVPTLGLVPDEILPRINFASYSKSSPFIYPSKFPFTPQPHTAHVRYGLGTGVLPLTDSFGDNYAPMNGGVAQQFSNHRPRMMPLHRHSHNLATNRVDNGNNDYNNVNLPHEICHNLYIEDQMGYTAGCLDAQQRLW